jgi:integrase/recombinase XerC
MRCPRGLCDGTRRLRIGIARRFLQSCFGDQPIAISALQPTDVRRFIASQSKRPSVANAARARASALRAYFRFRATCGDPVHTLTGVIATPAQWSLASLPRSLTRTEVDRLLASFTPQVPSYRRGYAMVRCALDLGLRVGEIAKLRTAACIPPTAFSRQHRLHFSRRAGALPNIIGGADALGNAVYHATSNRVRELPIT